MSMDRAHSAWKSAESVKKLSDRVVGIGPFSIGLDGILTWIPGAGLIYSAGASVYLLYIALSGGASAGTLFKMAGYLGLDVLLSDFPIPGVADMFDLLWQGHLLAAGALQKDVEGRHGVPPEHMARVAQQRLRRGRGLGWIVFLLVLALGYAVWRSDFNESLHLGWWPAFQNASVTLFGYTLALPIVTGALLVLTFLINAFNRSPRRA